MGLLPMSLDCQQMLRRPDECRAVVAGADTTSTDRHLALYT
ncbi:hypothetical protein I542_2567 [Mycobacteroides abscessus 1948]|uniref:Uncharacterized protein n=2 Tax=Mycobacteroides abscessus TaxID=36809 RepID=A0A829QIT0_9MYCO|nr:hypothetical protein MM1S1520914_4010 [Mycobacteroides abscessus subsp. bolletii 1S-152-0914]ESV64966.1 hypothetical protein L833_2354 [Mycobacteroides abscessus MAB_091912_2446]ETZ83322.1 hypothetical protein L834_3558 [Mycobacteroides abscessus MAB_091912_2455]ETZ91831.1 hypothetical protein L828_1540 [Mycobacteroides abscessus MAB_030201_1061]EUA62420.1 hypothetical protein I542_2567 [Mycobacteroides abscessus 1948]